MVNTWMVILFFLCFIIIQLLYYLFLISFFCFYANQSVNPIINFCVTDSSFQVAINKVRLSVSLKSIIDRQVNNCDLLGAIRIHDILWVKWLKNHV